MIMVTSSSTTCFVGHTESIQDFLLGVEQSHISATGRKQLQTQHLSVSSSPPQHDPQHISDTQAGQMLIPWDYQQMIFF